jgi:hypothetical protein
MHKAIVWNEVFKGEKTCSREIYCARAKLCRMAGNVGQAGSGEPAMKGRKVEKYDDYKNWCFNARRIGLFLIKGWFGDDERRMDGLM